MRGILLATLATLAVAAEEDGVALARRMSATVDAHIAFQRDGTAVPAAAQARQLPGGAGRDAAGGAAHLPRHVLWAEVDEA